VKIVSIGGGPSGLYFAILMKAADPRHEITVLERNRADDTFGFGVVFSDATMANLREADPKTHDAIVASFAHWDDIETHYGSPHARTGAAQGEVVVSRGHGFAGLSRKRLLQILQERAQELGVRVEFHHDVLDPRPLLGEADLVLGADGVNSNVRTTFAEHFVPTIDWRPNRFVWLGTTRPFPAFTFYFEPSEHGLFRVHAYQYTRAAEGDEPVSTFIVECTEETWRRAGLDGADEDATVAYCERLFAHRLEGHRLIKNRSLWRSFPTVKNSRWCHENVVLVGDAAHTAHFSIGSGTKLALEDAIALRHAIATSPSLGAALDAYEDARRPPVESVQRAAQVSLEWFEETERYFGRLDPLQFTMSMLTRSLRITHGNLKVRDPALVERVDRAIAARAALQTGNAVPLDPPPPPMFTPFRLRDVVIPNRVVVSPMCMYSAEDGVPNDFHLVHLGSRAIGGAGLVMTEMTDVCRDGRISPGCTGMYRPEHIVAWRRVVDFVHQNAPAKIGLQLAHAGRKGSTKRLWEGIDEPLPDGNWPLLAPSPIPYLPISQVPKEMDRDDMDRVREDFVRAAKWGHEAGFDLLELHFAHGYLLGSFLSPLTNRRTDGYGGSLEARLRYPLEVFDAVRAAFPEGKPISVRVSATDWVPGGFEPRDAVLVARALKEHGCDIIDVSAGQTVADAQPVYGRLFQTPFADRVRHEAEIATMTVGNISSWSDVNAIIAAGRADLCVLARAHLYDPYWTRHAAFEQGYALPWPPQYVSARSFTPRGE
jgi:anthraniloyl-CoA monooxygenase